ncbi:hypothetical protein L226DRAFT_541076 [Lentinus tigrinus ALCF2SS1-7]|uniref:Uncharacterized protein n=1 Tax=Lentinus tigrinus ALCF2SS1-6 TaxID=1328759 RepID=A0A5C2RQF3_9APHY|nr:hypothetical protein L227DRAFT_581036 [Lentinus tigrinus ALCF2SS1-6]RPD67998.1 hypothetical protein L226DRAFT_541076 [Lentinus tigrinus ALCF2SS1-7]
MDGTESALTWDRDGSRLKEIDSIVVSLANHGRALYPWWHNLGRTLIEVTTLTSALGFFTLLTGILIYLVVRRRVKELYIASAIWIVPQWVSVATAWMTALSQAAQQYALLGSYIPAISTGTFTVAVRLGGSHVKNGQGDIYSQIKPAYTGHGCVGAALHAAKSLMSEGALCIVVLFFVLPEFGHRRAMRGVVIAPFLAACVSAALNVTKLCSPREAVVLESSMAVKRIWEIFEPRGMDPVTTTLTRLCHIVLLFTLVLWAWKHWRSLYAILNSYGSLRAFLVLNVIPLAAIAVVQYFKSGSPRESPAWAFALISAADSFMLPLMGMWPGLVFIIYRLRMPDDILPIVRGKDASVAGGSQLLEKSDDLWNI